MKALARRSSFSHRRSHDVLNVGGTSSTASSSLRSYTPETDAPPPPPLKPRMSISIVVRYMPLDSWVTLSIWEDTTISELKLQVLLAVGLSPLDPPASKAVLPLSHFEAAPVAPSAATVYSLLSGPSASAASQGTRGDSVSVSSKKSVSGLWDMLQSIKSSTSAVNLRASLPPLPTPSNLSPSQSPLLDPLTADNFRRRSSSPSPSLPEPLGDRAVVNQLPDLPSFPIPSSSPRRVYSESYAVVPSRASLIGSATTVADELSGGGSGLSPRPSTPAAVPDWLLTDPAESPSRCSIPSGARNRSGSVKSLGRKDKEAAGKRAGVLAEKERERLTLESEEVRMKLFIDQFDFVHFSTGALIGQLNIRSLRAGEMLEVQERRSYISMPRGDCAAYIRPCFQNFVWVAHVVVHRVLSNAGGPGREQEVLLWTRRWVRINGRTISGSKGLEPSSNCVWRHQLESILSVSQHEGPFLRSLKGLSTTNLLVRFRDPLGTESVETARLWIKAPTKTLLDSLSRALCVAAPRHVFRARTPSTPSIDRENLYQVARLIGSTPAWRLRFLGGPSPVPGILNPVRSEWENWTFNAVGWDGRGALPGSQHVQRGIYGERPLVWPTALLTSSTNGVDGLQTVTEDTSETPTGPESGKASTFFQDASRHISDRRGAARPLALSRSISNFETVSSPISSELSTSLTPTCISSDSATCGEVSSLGRSISSGGGGRRSRRHACGRTRLETVISGDFSPPFEEGDVVGGPGMRLNQPQPSCGSACDSFSIKHPDSPMEELGCEWTSRLHHLTIAGETPSLNSSPLSLAQGLRMPSMASSMPSPISSNPSRSHSPTSPFHLCSFTGVDISTEPGPLQSPGGSSSSSHRQAPTPSWASDTMSTSVGSFETESSCYYDFGTVLPFQTSTPTRASFDINSSSESGGPSSFTTYLRTPLPHPSNKQYDDRTVLPFQGRRPRPERAASSPHEVLRDLNH